MKKITVAILFALACITANAQIEHYKPIIMQLEDGNGVKEYILNNYNHSMMQQYSDSVRSVSVSMTLESSLDDVLVKWIADNKIEKNGKIIIKNKKTGEITNEYVFKGAKVSSFSDSHSNYSGYSDDQQSLSLYLLIKEYEINGVKIEQIQGSSY